MANWFGMPMRGAPRIKRKTLKVERAGRDWNGFYEQAEGRLMVCSAYGDRTEPIGRRKNLDSRAAQLLGEIVDEWNARPR